MEKKTIGSFIAALRKAKGMTQQEVADALNVSNKAVSRWERDECAPDLSLIPAVAELFGVTCDELLRGERIHDEEASEVKDKKRIRQLKCMVNRSLMSFKNLTWIAIALSFVGYILMLLIAYGFHKAIPAFSVAMLFAVASFVLTVIAINRLKEAKRDNELFLDVDPSILQRYDKTLANYSYSAFVSIVAVIMLSLPLLISPHIFVRLFNGSLIGIDGWVLSFGSYLAIYVLPFAIAFSAVVYLLKERYTNWICEKETAEKAETVSKATRSMNRLQLSALLMASLLFIVAPFFDVDPYKTEGPYGFLQTFGLALCLAVMVVFVVFLCKNKAERKELRLYGIRNVIFSMLTLRVSEFHSVTFVGNGGFVDGVEQFVREDIWNFEIVLVLSGALCCYLIFAVIARIAKKKQT